MSDYQPKVGDRVMVSEHGPYEVLSVNERDRTAVLLHVVDGRATTRAGTATWSWLTPTPEPEPDEPTAPGALVKIETGSGLRVAARINTNDLHPWVVTGHVGNWSWVGLKSFQSPITVILADPAEVETLRADRDELRRTIDRALNELACAGGTVHRAVTILRGES